MRNLSQKVAIAFLCASLAACDAVSPLKLLPGKGTNVAANGQAGRTNSQTIGQTNISDQKMIRPKARTINQSADSNRVRAESVETVVVQGEQVWLILAFAVAVFLDSPARWPGQIAAGIRSARRKRQHRSGKS